MKSTLKRTWVEIDLDALEYNYNTLRKMSGKNVAFLGILKGDAYGHGAYQIAKRLEQLGADYLAVASIDEAIELRTLGIGLPILIFADTPADQVANLIAFNLTQTVSDYSRALEYDAEASKSGKPLKVHIKIDSGMSRLGILCTDAYFESGVQYIVNICRLSHLEFEGIYTHFSLAYSVSPEAAEYTKKQFETFNLVIKSVQDIWKNKFKIRHCASTGAVTNYPETYCDMIRPGSLLYGWGTSAEKLGLKPVMSFKTVVGTVKEYPKGTPIGYNATFVTQRDTRVGILPVGYADGFSVSLSNKWQVITADGMAPQIGRICMDMCVVDITDCPNVGTGDEVEIFGNNNSLLEMSQITGTLGYEITALISKRVPRRYISNGEIICEELLLRG